MSGKAPHRTQLSYPSDCHLSIRLSTTRLALVRRRESGRREAFVVIDGENLGAQNQRMKMKRWAQEGRRMGVWIHPVDSIPSWPE
jgi:hypothetical protein